MMALQPLSAEPAQLGPNANLGNRPIFPADNPWNEDISSLPVAHNSAALIASIGLGKSLHADFGTEYRGAPNGIPYVVVGGSQKTAEVHFRYADESDKGPYPIPPDAPIEGGPQSQGDRHVLILDRDHWKLFELFHAQPPNSEGAPWVADSGAIFDLTSNKLRRAGWTSADAAGLPILPGLARYEEVMIKMAITHALRFTCGEVVDMGSQSTSSDR